MRISLPLCVAVVASALTLQAAPPLALHPENPHYFLFRGQPLVLITSAEHYGAVLNAQFNYERYLDELAAHGLNLTRTFSGAYVEDAKSFGITGNTLAPAEGQFLCPWARSDTPGYAGGGNKFDLRRWDEAYFRRLRDFVAQAGRRGVIVEMNLFCPFYDASQWRISPQNAANNTSGVGQVPREHVYTLDKHGGLLAIHEDLTRKIVSELNEFDNVYYEVCNEPYFGGVTQDWQHRIVDTIVAAERDLPHRHLISLNIANGAAKIERPHPAVSIFNFHYASPPDAVTLNFALNKVIGDNETGFKGTGDTHYRMEAWEFLLAGGGLYNNLDYSFTVGHEDGSFPSPAKQPGGGNRGFRQQMKILKDFLTGFKFLRMGPAQNAICRPLPQGIRARVLAEPGHQYAVYVFGGRQAPLAFSLPEGGYRAEWVNPRTGQVEKSQDLRSTGEEIPVQIDSPEYDPDVALRILRQAD
jgi:hypothetical protein